MSADVRDVERAKEAGFDVHLTKPATPAQIAEAIARLDKAQRGA